MNPEKFLIEYARKGRSDFEFELVRQGNLSGGKIYILSLTSQNWRGHDWRHWLKIFMPAEARYKDGALLVISGGDNKPEPPPLYMPEIPFFALCANRIGAPVAVLTQVPNQPMYGGLKSDGLIAMSFDRFLKEGDRDWPLLLPMMKSSVRAMDAVQDFADKSLGLKINQFILCGGSKWGWTAYLAAAIDGRVQGIAPVVIDILNIQAQMERQKKSYGKHTDLLSDYSELDLMESLVSEKGRELARLVDPYTYRKQLVMPKLLILGTNDPYWTVDSANLYFHDLPEPKYLHYAPGTGHDLSVKSLPVLLAFIHSVLGKSRMPAMEWGHCEDGSVTVRWEESYARAEVIYARSAERDFRRSRWHCGTLNTEGKTAAFQPEKPGEGYFAYFITVSFPEYRYAGFPVSLSTSIKVLPEEFPFEGSAGRKTGNKQTGEISGRI